MGIYKNVMELLVEEEVARQFNALPDRMSSYINPAEWTAYALNQLPPLYATSEKGLTHQIKRGRSRHGTEIKQAVQRALAAVRRDPLLSSTPLQPPEAPLQEILLRLRFLLRNDRLDWEALPVAVEQALEQASRGGPHRSAPIVRTPAVYAPVRGSSPFPSYLAEEAPTREIPREPARTAQPAGHSPSQPDPALSQPSLTRPAAQENLFGWDDPLYNPR